MQKTTFFLWTLAHILVAVTVAMTAPAMTTYAVLALILCAQIAVYFNASKDEGIFEETSQGGILNLMRSIYVFMPWGVIILAALVLYPLITVR